MDNETFTERFPDLSEETLDGLKRAGYSEPTEIQTKAIKPALEGKDVLASAKTGSGKTVAFIVPLLECLHKDKWSSQDGLGALVVTPTRELAYQIFEVLRSVGQRHQFSAALVIGGKDLAMERKRIEQMNIIICTPGRMQQHMEENPSFYGDNIKIMVIDEADRLLDMGFRESIDFIVNFLPKDRQCLLFSATQTKSVKDLARLSLKDPVLVAADENSTTTTPDSLKQKYTIINLEQKLAFVWSFIKRHKKSKIIVFIATCKQTRFIHDLFCRMHPGISINALHGGLSQPRRMDIYNKFYDVRHCVLLATDIAARGLDFPDVDWVVQLDCPEDPHTYIHRVGRTARCDKTGRSLMVLMPNEKDYMLAKLAKSKVLVEEVPTREKHLFDIRKTVEAHLTRDVELKEKAKRAFKSYLKSIKRLKAIFDVDKLNIFEYSRSLGLEIMPRDRAFERRGIKMANKASNIDSDEDDDDLLQKVKRPRVVSDDTISDRVKTTSDAGIADVLEDIEREQLASKNLSKAKLAKQLLKKNIRVNKHVVFNKD